MSCPSCGSADRKTAKMVVLEGTTMSTGVIEGSVRDKGIFGGGWRSFLLSDRWFSIDHDLRAGISLETITALAASVKTALASRSEVLFPPEPAKPRKIGFLDRVTPVDPGPASAPLQLPAPPKQPAYRPWREHFGDRLKARGPEIFLLTGLIAAGAAAYGGFMWGVVAAIPAFFGSGVLCAPLAAYEARNGRAYDLAAYEKQLEEHKKRVHRMHADHEESRRRWHEKKAKFEADLLREREQKEFERSEPARYERELALYREQVARVTAYREHLWGHTHVCLRCSHIY